MAIISIPLGYKVVDQQAAANTGTPIDDRQVFSSETVRDDYTPNFFYEGLLSYTVGLPFHVSGITSDAGFYYRDSANNWVGLNTDTVDDKHAYGTMDSSSNATSDPTTGTNIVDHVNYLYTLTDALSGSRQWLDSVTTYAQISVVYPAPTTGDSVLVTSENKIYTYNGSSWVLTGSNTPSLSSTVDGIVNHTWYTDLNDVVANTGNYLNKNVFSTVYVTQGGANVGSVTAASQTGSFTLNAGNNITLSQAGSVVTITGSGGGTSISANNTELIYKDHTGVIRGATALRYTGGRLIFGEDLGGNINNIDNAICIGRDTMPNILDGVRYEEYTAGDNNIAIGHGAGYNMGTADGVLNWGQNNLLLGNTAGYDIPFNVDNRFVVSMGTYSAADAGESNFDERRLLDGNFPGSNAANAYGSLKIRGVAYFKEEDTSINRLEKNLGTGDWDMVFTSAEAGSVYLSDILTSAATGITSSTNGLTDDGSVVSLGGTLTADTTIDGAYDLSIDVDNITLSTNNGGVLSLNTGTTPATYLGTVAITADQDLVNKKYVDDLFDTIGTSHNPVTINATANGLSIGAVTQVLTLGLASTNTTGALSSTNWNTFNDKQSLIATGTTAQYYRGDKSWQTLDTDVVPQGVNNLYFTAANVRSTVLTGLNKTLTGDIFSTDTVLQALGKLQYQLDNISVGGGSNITLASPANGLTLASDVLGLSLANTSTTGAISNTDWNTFNNKQPLISTGSIYQYYRGDKTWQLLNTAAVVEDSSYPYYADWRVDDRFTHWSGIENGFAPLNSSLKIPSSYLPSYMDEVLEYANLAAFPVTGSTSVIYVALNDNKTYRWSGSTYIEISPASVNSVNGQTGVVTLTTTNISEGTNLYFTAARVRSTTVSTITADTGDVLSTDSFNVAISKLQNRVTAVSLVSDILDFSTDKYTPYSVETSNAFWLDSTTLKYGGDFGATSVKSDTFSIGDYWRIIVDPLLTSKLLLQYDTTQDGLGWTNVTSFEGIV